jgi:microcystin-dependent protein
MRRIFTRCRLLPGVFLFYFTPVAGQVGIGTRSVDPNSILDIVSTTKGLLIPRLSAAQQATLAGTLTSTQTGMVITDAGTGQLLGWNGQIWTDVANLSASSPLSIGSTNQLSFNAGTQPGDLITWDGTNWVNMQPAIQHFSDTIDNRQPFLAVNFCIALQGIFPSRSDAVPFVSEIQIFPFNFAPTGWAFCNGQLLSITGNTALFSLIGTFYGGNGTTNFQLPNLQGRVAMGFGQGTGLSNFSVGQSGGVESQTISQ